MSTYSIRQNSARTIAILAILMVKRGAISTHSEKRLVIRHPDATARRQRHHVISMEKGSDRPTTHHGKISTCISALKSSAGSRGMTSTNRSKNQKPTDQDVVPGNGPQRWPDPINECERSRPILPRTTGLDLIDTNHRPSLVATTSNIERFPPFGTNSQFSTLSS